MGKATLESVSGLSPAWLIALVLVAAAGLALALERYERNQAATPWEP
jgi:hypothetical protein